MFSRTLAEAYDLLEPHGPAWEQQLRADMQVSKQQLVAMCAAGWVATPGVAGVVG